MKFRWSDIQRAVSEVEEWFECDLFKLNENKCKEMRVDLAKKVTYFPATIKIDGKPVQVADNANVFWSRYCVNLNWNSHVNNIVSKISKRICLLVQLKRAKVQIREILHFYSVCVRSIPVYVSTVFHYSLLM